MSELDKLPDHKAVVRWTGAPMRASFAGGFVAYGDYLGVSDALDTAIAENARLREALILSRTTILRLVDQQAMPDEFWKEPLATIDAALHDKEQT
jgi:hypothetical protein